MRRFIGALIFGVLVVIFMLTQWHKEQRQEATDSYLHGPVEGELHNEQPESDERQQ